MLDVLSVYDRLGCDVIDLQEIHRSGHSTFTQAAYLVHCSGACGGENGGKKGQGGVGLALRTLITRAARPPEFISNRLLKVVVLQLRGRAKTVTFLWRIPQLKHKKLVINLNSGRPWTQLFVLMDANVRTARNEKEGVASKDNNILSAYVRDILNDNEELLLFFANNHDLVLVNTFFSSPNGGRITYLQRARQ